LLETVILMAYIVLLASLRVNSRVTQRVRWAGGSVSLTSFSRAGSGFTRPG
jgi:hypothetical protein